MLVQIARRVVYTHHRATANPVGLRRGQSAVGRLQAALTLTAPTLLILPSAEFTVATDDAITRRRQAIARLRLRTPGVGDETLTSPMKVGQ